MTRAVTGHAEILEQQISREHVARGKIAQSLAVIEDRGLRRRRVGLAQEQIERTQPPLDIAMLDDQVLALDAAALAGLAEQLFGERGMKRARGSRSRLNSCASTSRPARSCRNTNW